MLTLLLAALLSSALPTVAAPPGDDDDARSAQPPDGAPKVARRDGDDRDRDRDRDGDDDDDRGAAPDSAIVVTARRLDSARTGIDAELGASAYTLDNETIENRPGGETGSVAGILSQTPGVTLSGQGLQIRGSNAVQVRINNVVVPEAISDPADRLSSRFAQTTRVLAGTLPAQFGFAPGGVVSVTTKNGLYQHGAEGELFAGNHGMVEPALEWAGSSGGSSLFASGSYEAATSTLADQSGAAARDKRREFGGLAFADHVIDPQNRISAIVGGSSERNFIGATSLPAGRTLDSSGYAVGTLQHSTSDFTLQASLFAGAALSQADFATSQRVRKSSLGTQVDASWQAGERLTLRAGLMLDRATSHAVTGGVPEPRARRTTIGVYVQDQYRLASGLDLNAGLRADWLHGFASKPAFEPRASLVWTGGHGLSLHAGYARYAAAAPLEDAAAASGLPDERDDYFGAGIQQRIGALSFGIDGYWRDVHGLIAERLTPGKAEATPFEFARAHFGGVELSATYAARDLNAWANLSVSKAQGRGLIAAGTPFSLATLAYSNTHWLALASDRPVSGSAGVTWHRERWTFGADLTAGSGAVTTIDPAAPNAARAPAFASLGLSVVYHIELLGHAADLRADLVNVTNAHFLTSDGANLEGGWTRRDPGRAVMIGIEQSL